MSDFIGRTQQFADKIDPWKAEALHHTLDLDGPAPGTGAPLPHFWHWIYFLESRPLRDLGRDGHPATGGFIPDLGLPRRMWAGSRLEFLQDLPIGAAAERKATIAKVDRKIGRTGPLAFVTIEYEVWGPDGLCIREEQDIVYREDPKPDAPTRPPGPAPEGETRSVVIAYTPTKLFRYSALTFNGHRIHYDRDYAVGVEGYGGLITHGPLIAQEMLLFGETAPGRKAARYDYRAMAPAFDFEALTFCAADRTDGADLWVRGPDGRLVMQGSIVFA